VNLFMESGGVGAAGSASAASATAAGFGDESVVAVEFSWTWLLFDT